VVLARLWLTDFRCFESTELAPARGVTVIHGVNGAGKTSLLEAVGVLATMKSFRGANREALVRQGAQRAVARAEIEQPGRRMLIEAELPIGRAPRIQVNRQVARRIADLGDALRVTVFSPDDLELVQGPPGGRRDFLDSWLAASHVRMEGLVGEVERVLRQRAALLHQSQGDIDSSLDVWDERLAQSGSELVAAREQLVEDLGEPAAAAYDHLAGRSSRLAFEYKRSWEGDLHDALRAGRAEDVRLHSTGRGPHRDELVITLDGMPARTHASQGEQRCAALALRLAVHELATGRFDEAPVLLLDDVFSELDPRRAELLAERLPPGQVLLATAAEPPKSLSGSVVYVEELKSPTGG
jgi:DNA replication and repair protein RecF